MTTPEATDELVEATRRLLRSVDALRDEDYGTPSLLPDWSRGHVVAHLALNAEGLSNALTGVVTGEPRTTYASDERRDADIEHLAGASPSALRERLFAAASELADAIAAVPEDAWDTVVERTPGGATFPAGAVPGMRLREVELHHADLDAGYSAADWPTRFTVRLLRSMARRTPSAEPFTADPHDLDETWQCGAVTQGSPVVRGSAADLAWWLAGRGDGAALMTDGGALPRIEAW
ncbi:maleylpyruvate isomerase family mycothiol-dependent enzyme [Nocardioides sp. cx-169]|uniref:maleylpyruvate isomerase family mycothiol-dependent enzyme n=1 Tax=Nocardioides sp. cx-169 TaxID=2899080 RepID=UPI001E437EA4|nr:maleylpyruvate isomerase family mycothiol-dependent enzyme [Nocardioides sp. cx-169]MCD4535188.1 maleylpyruvate isomerase family mycothiol-dependent enzyme [Nocardioides sp. cx-169]